MLKPALVEDDDQGGDGQGLRELWVRQADQVETVVADRHADAEEQQKARHPQPVGQPRAQHPGDQKERAPEQELVRRQLEVHTSASHAACRYGAGVSDTSEATINGVHHFSPTVSDVEASATWYEQVFSMMRLPIPFAHHEREETGYAVVLIDPVSGLAIGLHHNEANEGEPFDECRTGLDHIGFAVPTRASLDAWAAKLDGLGIAHSGVREISDPMPLATLVFRDPDNIQLEFIHSP